MQRLGMWHASETRGTRRTLTGRWNSGLEAHRPNGLPPWSKPTTYGRSEIQGFSPKSLLKSELQRKIGGMAAPHFDFSKLTPAERIQLAEDLWDSLDPDSIQLTDPQRRDLERRLAAYRAEPDPGEPWRLVLDRIESTRAR